MTTIHTKPSGAQYPLAQKPIEENKNDLDFIPENHLLSKILACVPLVGFITTKFNEHTLDKKFPTFLDDPKKVEIIKIKNDYKIASLVRTVLSLAALVTIVALTVFNFAAAVAIVATGAIIAGTAAGIYARGLYHNHQLIKGLNQGVPVLQAALD